MKRFRRIWVGIDLDPETGDVTRGSRNAADQAVSLARHTGARVSLVHGSDPDGDAPPISAADAGRALGALASGHREGDAALALDATVSDERPWLAAIHLALRREIDLVVVGKRNEPNSDGRHIGTTAGRLLRKCPCPVWFVHPAHPFEGGRVLAATDLEIVGTQAVQLAADLARLYDAELHVVHALQVPMSLQLELGRLSEEDAELRLRELHEEVKRAIEDEVAGFPLPRGYHMHVGRTSPSRGVLSAVEALAPDLLVMGSLSRGGVAGLLVGNTAERLLGRVDCSLLTIKPDDFVTPVSLPPAS